MSHSPQRTLKASYDLIQNPRTKLEESVHELDKMYALIKSDTKTDTVVQVQKYFLPSLSLLLGRIGIGIAADPAQRKESKEITAKWGTTGLSQEMQFAVKEEGDVYNPLTSITSKEERIKYWKQEAEHRLEEIRTRAQGNPGNPYAGINERQHARLMLTDMLVNAYELVRIDLGSEKADIALATGTGVGGPAGGGGG